MFRRGASWRTALIAATLAAAPWAGAQAAQDCSTLGQTTFVRDTLNEYYFWYRDLKPLDPALYDSPEAYLDAVRYRPLDNTYSYVNSKQQDAAFFSDSQFVGLGFSSQLFPGDVLRVSQVFPDSPASDAGLARGDSILQIDRRTIAQLSQAGALGGAFGPGAIGFEVELLFRHLDGREVRARLVKRLVTIPTVSLTQVYERAGRKIGYVLFRNFVQPSFSALAQAFGQLRAAEVDELVLDLRYNGGGLVSVAQYLGGLIGGARTGGQVFCEFFHNDKNSFRNQTLRFEDQPVSLDFERVTVITTRASASASELVVSALRPFVKVTVVGDATYGKPVGQYGFDFCDKVLYPVAFTLRNAEGQGDYFSGIPADCPAADDLEHAFGDPAEASLGEALYVSVNHTCSAAASGRPTAGRALRPARAREAGFEQLLGAH